MHTITEIQEIAYHRNGVCGQGFHVVRFAAVFEGGKPENFIATLFGEHQCAVISLDRIATEGVAFTRNSWRGDTFEYEIRQAIDNADAAELSYDEEE